MGGWLKRQRVDITLVTGIWAFTAFLIGAQPWVSFDTPDSEFHASMSIYGSEVTDRAALPVYYWTRIGHIAPAHALTGVFGPLAGLEIYRLVLLAIIVISLFAILRRFTNRFNTTILTTLVAANTVLLGYLGNPYPTATAIAAMFILMAAAIVGRGWVAHLTAGAALGWLVMTSPYGTLLGVVMYAAAVFAGGAPNLQPRSLLRRVVLIVVGAATTFSALWLIGRALFPSLDWLSTYLNWNSALNQADYINDLMRWTHDPSLLVPALAGVVSLVWLASVPRSVPIRIGAALAVATPVFALLYWWRFPSNYLEIPHYQAMLFPAALVAVALVAADRLPQRSVSWTRGITALLAIGVSILAGHAVPAFTLGQSRLIAIAAAVIFLIPWGKRWIASIAAIGLTFSCSQLLQNSRDNFGVSTNHLYANAYLANDTRAMMESATEAQSWVLSKTTAGDRVLTWVDADWASQEQVLLPLAAFQLWGANEVAQGPTITPEAMESLAARKPLSIVMYGKTLSAILDFWNGLPKEQQPSIPECMQVAWPQTQTADVCVTHLQWQ
jgi:hypothetical protein